MNTRMTKLPSHGSSQPLLSFYTRHYQEHTVSEPCWLLFYEFYGIEDTVTYIPNGCMDFLIHEQDNIGQFCQASTGFAQIPCMPGCRYFGVRFPVGMLPDRHFSAEYFANSLIRFSSFEERIHWFCKNFHPEQECMSVSEPVRYMLEQICLSNGTISIHQLSEVLCYSERHIHRMFLSHMGYSPKLFSRIIRFQSALTEMMNHPGRNISDYIKQLDYSDQAHFQREFKEFTGMTPRQLMNLL